MYRVTYSKEGLIKFISHLDLIRLWQRALRRAGVKVEMSKGFSPHPRISFGPPLPLGIAGNAELMDVAVVDGEMLMVERLQSALPCGIRVREVHPVLEAGPSLCAMIDRATYEVEFDPCHAREAVSRFASARESASLVARRVSEHGERVRDVKPLVEEIRVGEIDNGKVRVQFTVKVGDRGNLNPHELLEAVLGWPAEQVKTLPITRTALFSSSRGSDRRPRIR